MIKPVKFSGREFCVVFHYEADETWCYLVERGDSLNIAWAMGVARRHPKDAPNRNIGRDLAFRGMLKDAAQAMTVYGVLPKEVRAQIAYNYFHRKG